MKNVKERQLGLRQRIYHLLPAAVPSFVLTSLHAFFHLIYTKQPMSWRHNSTFLNIYRSYSLLQKHVLGYRGTLKSFNLMC